MHSPGTRVQLGAIPSGGSISQSSQRSDEFHKLIASGAAPETATILSWSIDRDSDRCRNRNKILWIETPPGHEHAFPAAKGDPFQVQLLKPAEIVFFSQMQKESLYLHGGAGLKE